jgi:hypothetical protein
MSAEGREFGGAVVKESGGARDDACVDDTPGGFLGCLSGRGVAREV